MPDLSAIAETVMPDSLIFSLSSSTFATIPSLPSCEPNSLYHRCEFMSTLFHNFVELFYTSWYYVLTEHLSKEVSPMLDLYKNIKEKRMALKMSQDTLAELTGYKDRSSIAKIEKGDVDISESKIREFAKALKTTPQELMGWDEIEKPTTMAAHFDGDEYTEEELNKIKEFAAFVKSNRK